MTEKLKTGRNLADLLCWCCMYFGLCASVLYLITQNSNQFIIALTLAVTLIGTVYLSVRARAIFYIGYHILLIAITWGFSRTLASPGLISTWAITVLILFQMILFFSKRLHSKEQARYLKASPALAILFFVLWIISNGMGHGILSTVLVVTACVYLLSSILTMYLTNMLSYITGNRQMANMPVRALVHSGNFQISLFMLLALGAMVMFTNMGLGQLFNGLKNLLLAAVRFLFSFAPSNEETTYSQAQTSAPLPDMETNTAPLPDDGTSPILIAASDFIMALFRVILVVGAAALVIFMIYQLIQRFNGLTVSRSKEKAKEPESEDVIEKIITPKGRRTSFFFSSALPDDKIRRIYYKKISGRHKKSPIDRSMSPQELTESISPQDSEAARQFTEIYERVRYSGRTETEDVAAYKNLAKKV